MVPHVDRLLIEAARSTQEKPSRRLDADIYCALHNIWDQNRLTNEDLVAARRRGEVLLDTQGDAEVWIEAPPFTTDLTYAETLLPDGVCTIIKDPMTVCAIGLRSRARLKVPPLQITNLLQFSVS